MIRCCDYFKGATVTIEAVLKHPKIEVMFNWDIVDATGVDFCHIGAAQEHKDRRGKERRSIITDENLQTFIKGVFAAGDIHEKTFRQITTTVADGTIATLNAEKAIKQR